jgi:hypothetical protein
MTSARQASIMTANKINKQKKSNNYDFLNPDNHEERIMLKCMKTSEEIQNISYDEKMALDNHLSINKKEKFKYHKKIFKNLLQNKFVIYALCQTLVTYEVRNIEKTLKNIDTILLMKTIQSIKNKEHNDTEILIVLEKLVNTETSYSDLEKVLYSIKKIFKYMIDETLDDEEIHNCIPSLIPRNDDNSSKMQQLSRSLIYIKIYEIYLNFNKETIEANLEYISIFYLSPYNQVYIYLFEINNLIHEIFNKFSDDKSIIELGITVMVKMNQLNHNILYINLDNYIDTYFRLMVSHTFNYKTQIMFIDFFSILILNKYNIKEHKHIIIKFIKNLLISIRMNINNYDLVTAALYFLNKVNTLYLGIYNKEHPELPIISVILKVLHANLDNFVIYSYSVRLLNDLIKYKIISEDSSNLLKPTILQIANQHLNKVMKPDKYVDDNEEEIYADFSVFIPYLSSILTNCDTEKLIHYLQYIIDTIQLNLYISIITDEVFKEIMDIAFYCIDKYTKNKTIMSNCCFMLICGINNSNKVDPEYLNKFYTTINQHSPCWKGVLQFNIKIINSYLTGEINILQSLKHIDNIIDSDWAKFEFLKEYKFLDELNKIIKYYYNKNKNIMEITLTIYKKICYIDKSSLVTNKKYINNCVDVYPELSDIATQILIYK